jgi:hypothetical protein
MISKQFKGPREKRGAALGMLDLVGALESLVDPLAELRPGIGGIERLVGIHGPGGVGVGGDLPARQVDRLEAGADHLHRLVAAEGAERIDITLAPQQLPEPPRTSPGERMFDGKRASQPLHLRHAIGPVDAFETVGGSRDDAAEVGHCESPFVDPIEIPEAAAREQ